ncbi:MAG: outer membrane lipoprotein-sorting protein [Deltaproteobacteria bacterium]|nr:outer membrane lipoprotein-sorting protein [Deltaproteobacteria bacterium]
MLKKIVVICLFMVFISSYSFAVDKDVSKIVKEVEKILSLENIKVEQNMTVYRKDGTVRPYKMHVLTSGKNKSFAVILAPPREKGRQTLKLGDTVWSYLPSIKKSIRVSGRGSFMGGDFENNDVLRLNLVGDYTSKIIEELPDQYVLGLKGTDLSLSYAKIKIWVRKDNFQPLKQEYYTLSDKLIKSTFYKDIKDFNGFKRPSKLVMQSALNPKQKTVLEIIKFKGNLKNPSRIFRRSNLGK